MSILSFTPSEVIQGQLLQANQWYTISIKEVVAKTSKGGNGMFLWTFVVESHPQKPEVTLVIMESMKDRMVPILAAAEKKTVAEWMEANSKGTNVRLEDLVGLNLQGKLIHTLNPKSELMQNDFSVFLPEGMTPPL